MEVDNPGLLKRSNSAPMIPQISSASSTTPVQFSDRSDTNSNGNSNSSFPVIESRTRRSSMNFSPRHSSSSPKTFTRIEQLRLEEGSEAVDHEIAHENKIHSAMRISQSWDDLSVMIESPSKPELERPPCNKNKDGMWDPLNLHLSSFPLASCSPSPTRSGSVSRHCYSPGLFRVDLSPSPTRKTFATRRSLSPITIRPSSFGSIKRKFDLSENEPPAKRIGGLLLVHSNVEANCSPLPSSSVSSVGTPESISSVDSPGSFFVTPADSPSCDHPMPDCSKPDHNHQNIS